MRTDRHGLAALGWHPDSAASQLCGIVGMIVVAAVIVAFIVGAIAGAVLLAAL